MRLQQVPNLQHYFSIRSLLRLLTWSRHSLSCFHVLEGISNIFSSAFEFSFTLFYSERDERAFKLKLYDDCTPSARRTLHPWFEVRLQQTSKFFHFQEMRGDRYHFKCICYYARLSWGSKGDRSIEWLNSNLNFWGNINYICYSVTSLTVHIFCFEGGFCSSRKSEIQRCKWFCSVNTGLIAKSAFPPSCLPEAVWKKFLIFWPDQLI